MSATVGKVMGAEYEALVTHQWQIAISAILTRRIGEHVRKKIASLAAK